MACSNKRTRRSPHNSLWLQLLRAVRTFANLGTIQGMIAVDQVGNISGKKVMYVSGGDRPPIDSDGGIKYASFVKLLSSTVGWLVASY